MFLFNPLHSLVYIHIFIYIFYIYIIKHTHGFSLAVVIIIIMQPDEVQNTRESLENQLNELLQVLFELSVVVYDFQPDGNKLVWEKM